MGTIALAWSSTAVGVAAGGAAGPHARAAAVAAVVSAIVVALMAADVAVVAAHARARQWPAGVHAFATHCRQHLH